jgi:glycosyltransferase involved in cell wall biosynthesis
MNSESQTQASPKSPKNILFASWYGGLGGGETDLLTLAQDLNRADYTPYLLVPHEGQLAQAWRKQGGQVHVIPFRGVTTWFVPFIWTRLPVVAHITRLLREQHIHLVHSDYHTLPFMAGACQQAQVPLMWTVHGWWFRPQIWQRAFFRAMPAVARSHSVKDGFLGTPPFMSPDDLPVVYSGVDTARFHPDINASAEKSALGFAPNVPLVTLIARFQSVKGHEVFQNMAREIAPHLPNVQFIVAGENVFGGARDNAYKAHVLAIAKSDSLLQTRLHYIGFRDDVENIIALSDVVVCASDFESYGKVNLEAMACGKAVVSTNRGGPSETVLHGETGFLVPPQDAPNMAHHVMTLLNNPSLRAEMGRKGRERVLAHFSASKTIQAYQNYFARLLATPPTK